MSGRDTNGRSRDSDTNGRPRDRWIVLAVCVLVGLVLVGCAFIAGTVSPPSEGTIGFELRKYLIQFLLIVALGALVAFVVDETKRRAEVRDAGRRKEREEDYREQQYAIDTVRSVLERLDATYRRVKRTRQRLRVWRPHHREETEGDMWQLRNEQEDLEQLAKDIEVHKATVQGLGLVLPRVVSMEHYLGDRWKEYAKQRTGQPHSDLGEFGDSLDRFVSTHGDFWRFSEEYHEARRELVTLLVPVRLRSAKTPDAGRTPQDAPKSSAGSAPG